MSTMDLDCAELETVMAALLYDSAHRRPLLFSGLEVVLFVFSFALASDSVIQVLVLASFPVKIWLSSAETKSSVHLPLQCL